MDRDQMNFVVELIAAIIIGFAIVFIVLNMRSPV
jgi:hypothetical protein